MTSLKILHVTPSCIIFDGASNTSSDAMGTYGLQEAVGAAFLAPAISQKDGLLAGARKAAEDALLATPDGR